MPGNWAGLYLSQKDACYSHNAATLGLSGHLTPASLRVWEGITAVFLPTLAAQPITTCDCEECRDLRANLGHLRWNEVQQLFRKCGSQGDPVTHLANRLRNDDEVSRCDAAFENLRAVAAPVACGCCSRILVEIHVGQG